jgi:3-isopropylmalate dehydrogenase
MSSTFASGDTNPRLTTTVWNGHAPFDPRQVHVVGVLQGEGVGPEVVPVALDLLAILQEHTARKFEIRYGGEIGQIAKELHGKSLPGEVIAFVSQIFQAKGALFCGPGSERFVYDLRREFDLFCKFTPLQPLPELQAAGALRTETVADVNIIAVRENCGGLYQGTWRTESDARGRTVAVHQFEYSDEMICRIVKVALALATRRRKRLHVVLKPAGVPSVSRLWRECTERLAAGTDVEIFEHEVDNAVYQLIANPGQFDVIVSPNMFGDVMADCGSLLLASRGLSYSGNFNERGNGVYQTGHGAARDISGLDVVNPIGQIFSLGMMLRESFDWPEADIVLKKAVRETLREGVCTRDIAMPGGHVIGTRAFANKLKHNLRGLLAMVRFDHESGLPEGQNNADLNTSNFNDWHNDVKANRGLLA